MPFRPYNDDEHITEGYKALRNGDHTGALYHLASIRYVPPSAPGSPEIQEPIQLSNWLKIETAWLRDEILALNNYKEMQSALQQIASDKSLSSRDRAFLLASYEYSYLDKIGEYLHRQLTEATARQQLIASPYLAARKEAITQQLQQIRTRQTEILESLKEHT
jgi:hypothetical protein